DRCPQSRTSRAEFCRTMRAEVTVAQPQRLILLPARGLRATSPLAAPAQGFLRTLSQIAPPPGTHPRAVKARALPALPEAPAVKIKVLDSIADDGAKLIEIDPDSLPALRALQPGLRVAPVRYYRKQAERDAMRSRLKAAAAGTVREVIFRVVSA